MIRIISLSLTLLLAAACKKKPDCDGVVYSRNHVPVPNIPVMIGYSEGGKSQVVDYYHLTTNSGGHFSIDKKMPKKRNLENIHITSDSGSFHSENLKRNMEIILR